MGPLTFLAFRNLSKTVYAYWVSSKDGKVYYQAFDEDHGHPVWSSVHVNLEDIESTLTKHTDFITGKATLMSLEDTRLYVFQPQRAYIVSDELTKILFPYGALPNAISLPPREPIWDL